MKRLTALLVAAFLLGGCDDMTVAKAKYACRNDGGLYTVELLFFKPYAHCNNGKVHAELSSVVIEDPAYYPKAEATGGDQCQ